MTENWAASPLIADETPAELPTSSGARLASLTEVAPLLRSPISHLELIQHGEQLRGADGAVFPIIAGRPILYPASVLQYYQNGAAPIPLESTFRDALNQYIYLAQVKAKGWSLNSSPDDPWFFRHMQRSRNLLQNARGLVLDIGCDNPLMSSRAYSSDVAYVGLEPSLATQPTFSIAGLAEFLPFADESFDGASMMTSLDHILDYHSAIDEAHRVLKPGGTLYLATLIWEQRAELTRDNIHFHHFRDFEISGVLRHFEITYAKRYAWKDGGHRYGVYIAARKAPRS